MPRRAFFFGTIADRQFRIMDQTHLVAHQTLFALGSTSIPLFKVIVAALALLQRGKVEENEGVSTARPRVFATRRS